MELRWGHLAVSWKEREERERASHFETQNQKMEKNGKTRKDKKLTTEPVGQIKHFNTELVIAGHG